MKIRNIYFILMSAGLMGWHTINAQQTAAYDNAFGFYNEGLVLYTEQHYSAARKSFEKAIDQSNDPQSELTVNASYYRAICALELYNRDAAFLLKDFINTYPESPKYKAACFQMGRYVYRKRKWDEVIRWFGSVSPYDLEEDEIGEYYFKQGYSWFMMDSLDQAMTSFYEIRDVDTRYTAPARYYYAHISYLQRNYQTALIYFEKIQNHEKFSRIVPYYVAQIYYKQHKYEQLEAYATPLLERSIARRKPEIARLIGEAEFALGKYDASISYLEQFINHSGTSRREDRYLLGLACYRAKQDQKALDVFRELAMGSDTMAQYCAYYMGDIYLRNDNKKYAIPAFHSAVEIDADPNITGNALFNYAELSYETGYDPFGKALAAFRTFTERYPNDDRVQDAYAYMVQLFISSNDYSAALSQMEEMHHLSPALQEAYTKVAFNLGVEQFNSGQFNASIASFKKVNKYTGDIKLHVMALYWTGEAFYHLGHYEEAVDAYQAFIYSTGSINRPEFNDVQYNLGYAFLKQKKYTESIRAFRSYSGRQRVDGKKRVDAILRTADAYYMLKDYSKASDFYRDAAGRSKEKNDYPLYQAAMCEGLQDHFNRKVDLLEEMLLDNPGSELSVKAWFQLGKTYSWMDKTNLAVQSYDHVINEYPFSDLVREARMQKAILLRNQDKTDEALSIFREIAEDNPNNGASQEAIHLARKIYIDQGNVSAFKEWISTLPYYSETEASLDSASYESAYRVYLTKNCSRAVGYFDDYLTAYSNPVYALNAHYYRAQCTFDQQNYRQAIRDYEFVLQQPINDFTENAALNAAWINYRYGRYARALNNYDQLEKVSSSEANSLTAFVGQMRCFDKMNNVTSAREYATKVLNEEGIEENLRDEALMIRGRNAMDFGDIEEATKDFTELRSSANYRIKAQTSYYLAKFNYDAGRYDAAEQGIVTMINDAGSQTQWLSKAMVLLAGIYVKRNDLFQAKAIIDAVMEKVPEESDLAKEANKLKDEIIKLKEKSETPGETELQFEDFDALFENETPED